MDLSFGNFISQLIENPVLILITILINIVIFLNGWSDIPNALTTSITTRSLSPKAGLVLAGFSNFAGIFIMAFIGTNVAQTIYKITSFGNDTHYALLALCTALIAIVIWCLIAWFIGIPTSQNHALVAGLTGASIAINNGINGIDFAQWKKVLYGLFIATIAGFLLGFIISRIIEIICKDIDRRKAIPFFKKSQVLGDAAMIFMNGLQDSQKFLALLVMGIFLANGTTQAEKFTIPLWMLFICFIVMTIGTCIGGKRIIKSIGLKMTNVETYQGTAADIASFLCLIFSTLSGIPASTNQTKTTALMGVSASRRLSSVNWNIAKNIIITWVVTFPGCGILGYLFTEFLIKIF